MNTKEKMHEVRFPNIYILPHIIHYIVPLTIIIVLAIKAVGFSKARKARRRVRHEGTKACKVRKARKHVMREGAGGT